MALLLQVAERQSTCESLLFEQKYLQKVQAEAEKQAPTKIYCIYSCTFQFCRKSPTEATLQLLVSDSFSLALQSMGVNHQPCGLQDRQIDGPTIQPLNSLMKPYPACQLSIFLSSRSEIGFRTPSQTEPTLVAARLFPFSHSCYGIRAARLRHLPPFNVELRWCRTRTCSMNVWHVRLHATSSCTIHQCWESDLYCCTGIVPVNRRSHYA